MCPAYLWSRQQRIWVQSWISYLSLVLHRVFNAICLSPISSISTAIFTVPSRCLCQYHSCSIEHQSSLVLVPHHTNPSQCFGCWLNETYFWSTEQSLSSAVFTSVSLPARSRDVTRPERSTSSSLIEVRMRDELSLYSRIPVSVVKKIASKTGDWALSICSWPSLL